jgi:hypothetical protein
MKVPAATATRVHHLRSIRITLSRNKPNRQLG